MLQGRATPGARTVLLQCNKHACEGTLPSAHDGTDCALLVAQRRIVVKTGRKPARPSFEGAKRKCSCQAPLPHSYLLDEDAAPPAPLDEAAPLPEPPLLLDAAPPLLPDIPPLPLELPPEPDLASDVDDDDLLVLLPPLLP